MRPFNLDEYLANPSREVVTRDNRKVSRFLCTDVKSNYPIVALVEESKDNEQVISYKNDGVWCEGRISDNDLFFASEKHEGWINLYKNEDGINWISPNYFTSKKEAEKEGKCYTCCVTTIKIEWEE